MFQTILIRRGTKDELLNFGTLESGELGFCIDTKEVFIGDGTENNMVGGAMFGALCLWEAAGKNTWESFEAMTWSEFQTCIPISKSAWDSLKAMASNEFQNIQPQL